MSAKPAVMKPTRRTGAPTSGGPCKDISTLQKHTVAVLIISQIFGTAGVGATPSIGILIAGDVTISEAWAGSAVSLQSRFAATDLATPENKARS